MSKYHELRVIDVHRETPDSVVVDFEVPAELKADFKFVPGQHIGIKTEIDGNDVRRSYSICSLPEDGLLKIGIKHVENGLFSTFANTELMTGDVLEVLPPQGNFINRSANGKASQYVFFAAGSGITPIISLVRSILLNEAHSEVILFYGNRTSESIMFREEIEGLKNLYTTRFSVHHVLSREDQGNELYNGHIDPAKCDAWSKVVFDPAEVTSFFICGPEEMIISVRDWLEQRDVPADRVRFELFTTPTQNAIKPQAAKSEAKIDPNVESQITVIVDGAVTSFALPFGGQSILDAAMDAGADVPFSCKGGVCCTCKARLVEGEAEMDVVYGLEPDEIEAGYILTCQSHPRTEVCKVDYDV